MTHRVAFSKQKALRCDRADARFDQHTNQLEINTYPRDPSLTLKFRTTCPLL